jgi:hypothetical protein
LKKIVIPVVMLFGLLLAATIGISTAKPSWITRQEAEVVTPPVPPAHTTVVIGTVRAHVNVPSRAIDNSPALVATIEASTVAATIEASTAKPSWTTRQEAEVMAPPVPPAQTTAVTGTVRAHVNVPSRAIDNSPALQP